MIGITTSVNGFNPTWWFMGVIVPLYIVFPVLRRMVLLSSLLSFLVVSLMWLFGVRNAFWWLPFIAGMVAAKTGVFECTTSAVKVFDGICAVALMPVIMYARFITGLNAPLEMVYSGLLIYLIFIGNCLAVHFCKRSMLWLEFLGKHSMNIFFVHTFYYLFFSGFFNALNPFVGLFALLILSLVTSCIAEKAKEVVGFNLIINYVKEKLR